MMDKCCWHGQQGVSLLPPRRFYAENRVMLSLCWILDLRRGAPCNTFLSTNWINHNLSEMLHGPILAHWCMLSLSVASAGIETVSMHEILASARSNTWRISRCKWERCCRRRRRRKEMLFWTVPGCLQRYGFMCTPIALLHLLCLGEAPWFHAFSICFSLSLTHGWD